MSLTQFTITDRRIITDALKLSSDQLEENSRLYKELETIEDRDRRIPGLDRVPQIQQLLADIEQTQDAIAELETSGGSGGLSNPYGIKRLTVDDEYTIEYAAADGKVGAIGAKSAKLQGLIEQLGMLLGLPWADDKAIGLPVLWV